MLSMGAKYRRPFEKHSFAAFSIMRTQNWQDHATTVLQMAELEEMLNIESRLDELLTLLRFERSNVPRSKEGESLRDRSYVNAHQSLRGTLFSARFRSKLAANDLWWCPHAREPRVRLMNPGVSCGGIEKSYI